MIVEKIQKKTCFLGLLTIILSLKIIILIPRTNNVSKLFIYKSVRYKFLIFTFMFMSTSFLTNAVVINTKTMAGNIWGGNGIVSRTRSD